MWPDLEKLSLKLLIANRGFGGSQTSDLIFFWDKLIYQYHPSKVFINEGDNDLSAGKSIEIIMNDLRELVEKLKKYLPLTRVYFISPIPSIARWHLKDQYEQLNYQMAMWMLLENDLTFIDVWNPMCDDHGVVRQDLFIEDQLHMNEKGYQIWKEFILPYVEE